MGTKHVRLVSVAAVLLIAPLAACGTTTSSSRVSPSPSASAKASASASPSAPDGPVTRTESQLKTALLELKDLPGGFTVQKQDNSNGGNPTATSTDPACAPFVKLTNQNSMPGSTAEADISFSGGQSGVEIDEELDALGTPAAAADIVHQLETTTAGCSTVSLHIPGTGTYKLKVEATSAPRVGGDAAAARLTGTGSLAGFEMTVVTVAVGDAVLTMSFIAVAPADINGGTALAYQKAKQALGAGASGSV